MKFVILSLFLTGLIDASFVIQKMDAEPARKSMKSRSGQSLINAVSTIGKRQKSGSRKSRKTKNGGGNNWASSVNVISSVGSKSGIKSFTKGGLKINQQDSRKSYKRGKPTTMAPLNANHLSLSYVKGQTVQKDRKSSSKKFKGSKTVSISSSVSPVIIPGTSKQQKPQKHAVKSIKTTNNITIDGFVYVSLPTNQWTEFYFSEVGQLPFSRWTFDVPANQKCSLQVVDAYCAGDQFQAVRLLDTGKEVSLLSTPPVAFNPVVAEQIRQGSNVTCNPFTTDPVAAWASPDWSKGEVALPAGNYKLILKSLLAPYGSGGAYVRLSCNSANPTNPSTPNPQNVCSYGSSGIKYIRQILPFTQQANVCYTYGLRPLDVTSDNIREARNVLMNCAGVGTRAWVASYNGDNYRGLVGLSLHATQLSEVGAISASPNTSPLEGVLCQ